MSFPIILATIQESLNFQLFPEAPGVQGFKRFKSKSFYQDLFNRIIQRMDFGRLHSLVESEHKHDGKNQVTECCRLRKSIPSPGMIHAVPKCFVFVV